MSKVFIADSKKEISSKVLATEITEGISFVDCAEGEQFVEKVIANSPNVILLDSDFGDTFEILSQIKAIEFLSDVPIVYFTDKKMESSVLIKLYKNGIHDIVHYPFDATELSCRLSVLIDWNKSKRDSRNQVQRLNALHKDFDHDYKQFQSIVESIPLSVMAYDQDNTLVFMNKAAEMLTGFSQSKLQFKGTNKVYELLGIKESLEDILALQGEGSCRDVLENRHKRRVHIDRRVLTLKDEKGKILCHAEVFRDITTEIEFEEMMDARIEERSEGVVVTQNITMMSLASLAESRDNETGMHLERMRTYSKMIAEDLKKNNVFPEVNDQFVKDIFASSPLHDIGKVGIPDYVLLKPGKLSSEEWEIMKTHPTIGAKTLDDAIKQGAHASFLVMARDICASHHEKWDGSGYPKELKGEQIPISARIVSLADCYDALRSARVYKRAFTHEESRELILEKAGIFYDEKVIESFLRIEDKIIEVAHRFKDDEPTESTGANILDNR